MTYKRWLTAIPVVLAVLTAEGAGGGGDHT